jgi:hypothetical protein
MIAINRAISGVKKHTHRLKSGEINRKQCLFISRDTEQSILESKYAEVLKTKNVEYQALISEITSQTERHKELLAKKIEEISENIATPNPIF